MNKKTLHGMMAMVTTLAISVTATSMGVCPIADEQATFFQPQLLLSQNDCKHVAKISTPKQALNILMLSIYYLLVIGLLLPTILLLIF